MDNDDRATVPFPGIPASFDLSDNGCTLTLYWPTSNPQRIGSTQPWTDAEVRAELAAHGLYLAPAPSRASDAFTTTVTGLIAVGERLSAGMARVLRGLAGAPAKGHA